MSERGGADNGGGEDKPASAARRSFPELRARHHALRRQALLDLAVELVLTEGHRALTSQRLADELGCSIGSLYRLVPSLDVLRDAVLAELLSRQANELLERDPTDRPKKRS